MRLVRCQHCRGGRVETEKSTVKANTGLSVRLVPKGADWDVLDEAGEKWMLIDRVGDAYFLKHRKEGQEASTILACALIKDENTSFDAWVTSPGRKRGMKPDGRGTTDQMKGIVKTWDASDTEDFP